jgi:small subunit ribosomal protein S21
LDQHLAKSPRSRCNARFPGSRPGDVADVDFANPQGSFMAIRIKARGGETAEQMLRRFKKLCEKEGLTKDIKKRQYYEKPSERRRRDLRRRVVRVAREGMPPMAPR